MEIEGNQKKPQQDYDSDEDQAYREEIVFSFKPERNIPLSILSISGIKSNIIFVATAGHASAYLLAKLPEQATCIGYIYNEAVKIADIFGTEDNSVSFVIFESTLPPTIYFEFSKFFFEKFNAPKIIVLDSCHPNALPVFPQNVDLPALRGMTTTKGKDTAPICKNLEDACPVRGISGDILCYCEIHGIHAELYFLVPSDYDIIIQDILLYEEIAKKHKEISKPIDKKQLGSIVTKVSAKNMTKGLYL